MNISKLVRDWIDQSTEPYTVQDVSDAIDPRGEHYTAVRSATIAHSIKIGSIPLKSMLRNHHKPKGLYKPKPREEKPMNVNQASRKWIESTDKPFTSADVSAELKKTSKLKPNILSARLSTAISGFRRTGLIKQVGQEKGLKLFQRVQSVEKSKEPVNSPPGTPPEVLQTSPTSVPEDKLGEAVFDYVAKLKETVARLNQTLTDERSQARLCHAEHARQIAAKDAEITLLKNKPANTIVRRPRVMPLD